MLSRLSRQAISVYRQRCVLPCVHQHVRNASNTESSQSNDPAMQLEIYQWENVIERKEEVDKRPWREKVTTELSNDAPVYPSVFESPERDLVNFPRPVLQAEPAKTRMVIFPETWFKFMYEKMGVAGPYTLGLGLLLFCAQKEIIITHGPHWKHLIAWYMWWYVFTRTQLGDIFGYLIQTEARQGIEGNREFEKIAKENRLTAIELEKKQQGVAEGTQLIFDTKKENVGLQLEAAYRESVMDIYTQVKRRLDYQIEVGKIDSRIKQQFMINWVIEEVQKSLSKASEADTLKQCLSDLNTLAARV